MFDDWTHNEREDLSPYWNAWAKYYKGVKISHWKKIKIIQKKVSKRKMPITQ